MKHLASLAIVGAVLGAQWSGVRGASLASDWPSLNADASQTNSNNSEKALTSRNILSLKVKWTVPTADVSYPVVAGGRVYVPVIYRDSVHARAYDAVTGKLLHRYSNDASGGLLADNANLYLAGKTLAQVAAADGSPNFSVTAAKKLGNGLFLDPIADRKVVVVGYAGTDPRSPNHISAIDSSSNRVLWSVPSPSAQGTLGSGRVFAETSAGSAFYEESSGRALVKQRGLYSDWFAGSGVAYTVASIGKSHVLIRAFNTAGKALWSREVGPYMTASGWPHAIGTNRVFLLTLKPKPGIIALDPKTGQVLWMRPIADVQRVVTVNGMVLVLTYNLGQPVRVLALKESTGAVIGSVILSPGYFAFPTANALMVASGMIFVRVQGPKGAALVALGLPTSQ